MTPLLGTYLGLYVHFIFNLCHNHLKDVFCGREPLVHTGMRLNVVNYVR